MALGVPSTTVGRTGPLTTIGASVAMASTLLAGPVTTMMAGPASADDTPADGQHNVTYRARVDGLARGAVITYRISDTQINSADPTMLPGRTFETTAVLSDPKEAGMRISIQWPYSANLHCEILVDDTIMVQADQFVSPRVVPARDDPDYGAMSCGAPLSNAPGAPMTAPPTPATTAPPVAGIPSDVPAADLGAPLR